MISDDIYLSTKVVVFCIEESNKSCIDGGLFWHLYSTVTQDL